MSLIPDATHPFIVALKKPENDELIPHAVIRFENPVLAGPSAQPSWEELVEKTPLCHPFTIVAYIHHQWPIFQQELQRELELEMGHQKIASLSNVLRNEISYFKQDSSSTKAAISFAIHSPVFKDNALSFFLQLDGSDISHSFTRPIQAFASAQVFSQEWISTNLRLHYLKDSAPPSIALDLPDYDHMRNIKTPSAFSMLQDVLAGPMDGLTIGHALEHIGVPVFYKILWKAIGTDASIPGLLKHKILVNLYEAIIKNILVNDEHKTLVEQILYTEDWTAAESEHFHPYGFIPNNHHAQLMGNAKKVKPKTPAEYIQDKFSSDPMSIARLSAMANFSNLPTGNIIDGLQDIYKKFITPAPNAITLYYFVRALYRSVLAYQPDQSNALEKPYLQAYAESLRCALIDMEKTISRKLHDQANMSTKVTTARVLDESTDTSMRTLGHSPFAWQELLVRFKLDVALQNLALGYRLHADNGFTVQKVNLVREGGSGKYQVHYACGVMTGTFEIPASPEVNSFLRQKTQESFSDLPLTERVKKSAENLESAAQTEEERLNVCIRGVLGSLQNTVKNDRLRALIEELKKLMQPPMPSLSAAEKKKLLAHALFSAATSDEVLHVPVAEVFQSLVSSDEGKGVFYVNEIFPLLLNFQDRNTNRVDAIKAKERIAIALLSAQICPKGFKMSDLAPYLKDENTWSEFMALADFKDDQMHDLDHTYERDIARFISATLKGKADSYLDEEFSMIQMAMAWGEMGPQTDQTLKVLEDAAAALFHAVAPGYIPSGFYVNNEAFEDAKKQVWLTAVQLRSLSQSQIYIPGRNHTYQTHDKLALLSIADSLLKSIAPQVRQYFDKGTVYNGDLLGPTQKAIEEELAFLEADLLKDSVIPWYHEHHGERLFSVQDAPQTAPKRARKKKAKIAPPPPPPAPAAQQEAGPSSGRWAQFTQALAQKTQPFISPFAHKDTEDTMRKTAVHGSPSTPPPSAEADPLASAASSPGSQSPVGDSASTASDNNAAWNRLEFKDIVQRRVAHFVPSSNFTATPYHDPSQAIYKWLEDKISAGEENGLTQEDLPEFVYSAKNDVGPQALIRKYNGLKQQIAVWAEDESIPFDITKDFKEHEDLTLKIDTCVEEFESALKIDLSKPVRDYLACVANGHRTKLEKTESYENKTKEASKALTNHLLDLSKSTLRLQQNFVAQKNALNDLRKTRFHEEKRAREAFSTSVTRPNQALFDALLTFERDLLANAKLTYGASMFSKIVAHHRINIQGQHDLNAMKTSDAIHSSMLLRATLMGASGVPSPFASFGEQHTGLQIKRNGLQSQRNALTLWNPLHWLKIFNLYMQSRPIDKELSFFEKAQNAVSLADGFQGLLEGYSNKSKKDDTEYLLWAAQKIQDGHCVEAYKLASNHDSKPAACAPAIQEVRGRLVAFSDLPAPVHTLFETFDNAVQQRIITDQEKASCYQEIFSQQSSCSPTATASPKRFTPSPSSSSDTDRDLTPEELAASMNKPIGTTHATSTSPQSVQSNTHSYWI